MPVPPLTLVKLGGELLEDATALSASAAGLRAMASAGPLIVVHGGGRDIDAECGWRQISKRTVDGLRITDAATRDAVVAALAGTVNTRLVAALAAAGVRAVGLTGADGSLLPVARAARYPTPKGDGVDLGLVGTPSSFAPPGLIGDLISMRYVPVVASLGLDASGEILNVNADTAAAHLAVACRVERLLIAGGTAGVLDAEGHTLPTLDMDAVEALIARGTVTAGMVAKLRACRDALAGGVPTVWIVDGRRSLADGPRTEIVTSAATGTGGPGRMASGGIR